MSALETACWPSPPIHLGHLIHAVIVFLLSQTPNLLWISKYLPSTPMPTLLLLFKNNSKNSFEKNQQNIKSFESYSCFQNSDSLTFSIREDKYLLFVWGALLPLCKRSLMLEREIDFQKHCTSLSKRLLISVYFTYDKRLLTH